MGNDISKETASSLILKNYHHSLTLKVVYGDIVSSQKKAVVYTRRNGKFLSGGVGEALKTAGGLRLENACQKAERIDSNFFVSEAPGIYMTDHIFHVDVNDVSDESSWEKAIVKCLKEASSRDCDRVAFPAIGTGVGSLKAVDMAKRFENAIYTFSETPPCENTIGAIYLYIYQKEVFQQFKATLRGMTKWGTGLVYPLFTDKKHHWTEVNETPGSTLEPGQFSHWRE